MRGVALAIPLLLVACESREVVSICAASGDVEGTAMAAFHDAEGGFALLRSDATTQQSAVSQDILDPPILDALWRMAETTMRSLPATEPSPCGSATLSSVTVTFSDGSTITRHTSCTGNALARVASEVLEASPMDSDTGDSDTGAASGPALTDIRDACECLP